MRIATVVVLFLVLVLVNTVVPTRAEQTPTAMELAMSETLDLWRNGSYDQLFERLSHRGRTSREQFVKKMREAPLHPACCWQKMENFRVLNEKKTTVTVYVKIGLEGTPTQNDSSTREFKLSYEGGGWKMQLNDLYALAGVSGKKTRSSHKKSVYHR